MTMPFPIDAELCSTIEISADGSIISRKSSRKASLPPKTTVPGVPQIPLNDSKSNSKLGNFLTEDLSTPDLNKFHPYLWMVGTQSSSHITPLTEQAVRGRSIIITQNPELHLLWIQTRIYIKPLPKYLLSHAFWAFYFSSPASPLTHSQKQELGNAARGLLRSYAHLIRYKSDFKIAQSHGLISKKIKYSPFLAFISHFAEISDADVSARYTYAELRLNRLNFWAPLALGKVEFHRVVRNYGEYLAQYYGPVTFIFGIFVIVLGAMQVLLTTPVSNVVKKVCAAFSILTLGVVGAVVGILGLSIGMRVWREVTFAAIERVRGREKIGEGSKRKLGADDVLC